MSAGEVSLLVASIGAGIMNPTSRNIIRVLSPLMMMRNNMATQIVREWALVMGSLSIRLALVGYSFLFQLTHRTTSQ